MIEILYLEGMSVLIDALMVEQQRRRFCAFLDLAAAFEVN